MPIHRFQLMLGDITAMDVDAIVNSTDRTLKSGGPVHAAIHAAAGPSLLQECAALGSCPVGEARITAGHQLTARFVIHTPSPTWQGGSAGEDQLLSSCYRNSLRLALARDLRTIAFPSIASGLQPQIPLDRASMIAVRTILEFLDENPLPEKVVLVCFNAPTYKIYQSALKETLI